MKSRVTVIITMILSLIAAAMCLTACGGPEPVPGVLRDDGVMLSLSSASGECMTLEEYEASIRHYEVFYDGRAVDMRSGREAALSESDLQKLKDYADGIRRGSVRIKKTDGADLPSFSASAFDEEGREYMLDTSHNGFIDGFEDIRSILIGYFPEQQ